jgi:Raf kinase inhibitor-like YbhB/YbcL family protein
MSRQAVFAARVLVLGTLWTGLSTESGAQATGGARPPAGQPAPAAAQPPRAPARAPMRTMTLTSPDFTDGGAMPAALAQTGRDASPALSWSGVPDSTRSFVLIVHDADAPMGDGLDDLLHWMVWNIPATATSLPRGVAQGAMPDGMRQISVSGPYYRGPAAPSTGPAHHYVFELYALDIPLNVAATGMAPAATREAVMRAMAQHIRGKGVLVGTYRRPAP